MALMREMLLQWATAQETLANLPQTFHGCLLLTKFQFLAENPDIVAFVEGLNYVTTKYYEVAKHSKFFRDEDIQWPLNLDHFFVSEPSAIADRLRLIVEDLESAPKTGSKSQD